MPTRTLDTNVNAEERKFLEHHGERLSPSTHRAKWIHAPNFIRPDNPNLEDG